jgi:hypothetical protein
MEKVVLLYHLRGSMHHYPGAFILASILVMLHLSKKKKKKKYFSYAAMLSCLLSMHCLVC